MADDLGRMLVASGAITEDQLREALAQQRNGSAGLGETLVRLGFADESIVTKHVARQQRIPFVDLAKGRVPERLIERIPREVALEQGVVPVAERKDGTLVVAVDDHHKRILVDQLQFFLGCDATVALAAPGAFKRALARYYGASDEEGVASRMAAVAGADEDDAPIIRLVTRTFRDALEQRASDVHIEPSSGHLRVRLRVDGVLRDVAEHPIHLAAPLVSRLKVMGSMDIAEKRKPQDGRIEIEIGGRQIDVRASILPSNHGETMVMRLLDRSANLISLKELGFENENYAWFRRIIRRPNGIVLVTGPTGSGKTTTLYAALSELNRPDVKIITAEDPVEYHIAGINQVHVNAKIGLTFARILKAMLRAAPNIILVGEIRDVETAEVAIQAALTGHLVFSTLHTNDAASALTRLHDMGVQRFLVSTAVQAVLAQRLVRRLCGECAESYEAPEDELRALGLDPVRLGRVTLKRARGCRACDGAGYRGRLGLFELLEMDSELRDRTFAGSSVEDIRSTALATGRLRPLIGDGAEKVLAGRTSVLEVLRVTRAAAAGASRQS